MRTLILTTMLLVMACGEETGPGVGGQEAELHCRAWCSDGCASRALRECEAWCRNECNASACREYCANGWCDRVVPDAEQCRQSCRDELAGPCGDVTKTHHDCMTAMSCSDPFEDCGDHDDDRWKCQSDLGALCAECPEGSDVRGCNASGGDCGADYDTAECEQSVAAGRCPDVGTCLETSGGCPPDA